MHGHVGMPTSRRAHRAAGTCSAHCSSHRNNTASKSGFAKLPTYWLRHFEAGSLGLGQEASTYSGLKGWGRTRFVVRRNKLFYLPTPPNGCVLRRTPILAWALLSTLEHTSLPDVVVTFNCRDK